MTRARKRSRASGGAEDGAAALEFALILPLLLLLVLGIINFGYVFGQKLSLNQAVREGARLAVVTQTGADIPGFVQNATGGLISNPTTAIGVESSIQEYDAGAFGAFDGDETGATCSDYTAIGGQLRVTATYDAEWLVPLPLGLSAPTLTSEAVFRCEVIKAPEETP